MRTSSSSRTRWTARRDRRRVRSPSSGTAGPGSNSGLVHLLGFGPKRVTLNGLVDNGDSWLPFTDLVFVDPVGTGYSRPVKAAYEPEFYQPRGDAESVAEFIRVYRTRYDAFAQPVYLAGESYGVTRAALVAGALERRRTKVDGVIMLSLALPLGEDERSVARGVDRSVLHRGGLVPQDAGAGSAEGSRDARSPRPSRGQLELRAGARAPRPSHRRLSVRA